MGVVSIAAQETDLLPHRTQADIAAITQLLGHRRAVQQGVVLPGLGKIGTYNKGLTTKYLTEFSPLSIVGTKILLHVLLVYPQQLGKNMFL